MADFDAIRVVESLRRGIPPTGHVRAFTVGRREEVQALEGRLATEVLGALLLEANYGSGKTHLLKFIREVALEDGYAVSSLSLDARGGVRFNRMDQILGAVCRGIEAPNRPGEIRVAPFFSSVCAAIKEAEGAGETAANRLTDWGQWSSTSLLTSDALFTAVRAWYFSADRPANLDLIEDWLYNPSGCSTQRKLLYKKLVAYLRPYFRDDRPEWQFYADDVFNFTYSDYEQSWRAIDDLNSLAIAGGMRGLIILFDEFEDVIENLGNIRWQEKAFWNLFCFFSGRRFRGSSYFAVTPAFVEKCKTLLQTKGRWDYDFSAFDVLPTFRMSPLTVQEMDNLADRIIEVHAAAYGWDCCSDGTRTTVEAAVAAAMAVPVQDRARRAIRAIVQTLDEHIDELDI